MGRATGAGGQLRAGAAAVAKVVPLDSAPFPATSTFSSLTCIVWAPLDRQGSPAGGDQDE